MTKWNKKNFIISAKENCKAHISKTILELVKYAEQESDFISWGRGDGYGTMTFKCQSDDYGLLPLFHITTNGQIKFQLHFLRTKIKKKEILHDYQLKLESNFMLDFDEENYNSDTFFPISDLFTIHQEVEKFIETIQSITSRLKQ